MIGLLIEINSENGSPGSSVCERFHISGGRVCIAGNGEEKRVKTGLRKKSEVLRTLERSRPGLFRCCAGIKICHSVFSRIVDGDPAYWKKRPKSMKPQLFLRKDTAKR